MKQQQVTYALDRLRFLYMEGSGKIAHKFIDKKAAAKQRRLTAAYDRVRDEVLLGDEAKALELIRAFTVKVG